METSEFLKSLKRFIARRGRPQKICSDNGRTFVAVAKWLKAVMADEKVHDFLSRKRIQWQFNLSRAPWWGGHFERMIGIVKGSLYKTIGNGFLTWTELEEVVLDVEVAVNSQPLGYVEDNVKLPVLTPNSLLYGQPNLLPELEPHHLEDRSLRKRARYLKRCKEADWKRWTREYVRFLRERHTMKHSGEESHVGDILLINSKGRDGIVRAAKLRVGASCIERVVQHLFLLELSCDRRRDGTDDPTKLRAEAPVFRPSLDAAVAANQRIRDLAAEKLDP
ncbi:uncharacterized protein LOC122955922 [Acropora millepora]|uniref:uncharacterized protein LOC122955922 n=1 Tax=Acropora millepora TaxID=45264 RepID=UPI001CF42743|nr:uncharacterized protein LOC122955922 [Acropora millepora]